MVCRKILTCVQRLIAITASAVCYPVQNIVLIDADGEHINARYTSNGGNVGNAHNVVVQWLRKTNGLIVSRAKNTLKTVITSKNKTKNVLLSQKTI